MILSPEINIVILYNNLKDKSFFTKKNQLELNKVILTL